ncbi:MAG: cell division protein FtsZ, partial [Rickettsiales bacterium]|nr:cell division protein FtsZ [Rickettsiales bacterium]
MGIGFNNTSKFSSGVSGLGGSNFNPTVNISIMGVGGAGGNIIKYLSEKNLENVNLICANTDVQAMMSTPISNIIQLGKNTTRGLGAGSNPEVGEKSAIEAAEEIKSALHGTDMLIIVAGLGGGTGTGAAPVIAKIAREIGILVLSFVVTPFDFESERKMLCDGGVANLLKTTD